MAIPESIPRRFWHASSQCRSCCVCHVQVLVRVIFSGPWILRGQPGWSQETPKYTPSRDIQDTVQQRAAREVRRLHLCCAGIF